MRWMLLLGLLIVQTVFAEEDRLREFERELVIRGLEISASDLVTLCDDDTQKLWCEGYMAASVTLFEKMNLNLCIPRNDVGRIEFDGVWAITKSWLYRQPKHQKVSFSSALENALTESACGDDV